MSLTVSIALVTRNGAATLPAVLEGLSRQRVDFPIEIVAVDSGSNDGSLELLRHAADRVFTVPPEAFNHGLTRNMALEQTQGEFVVLLVQDAVPAGDTWLAELTAPLFADGRVAGTFARQLLPSDAGPITRAYFERAAVGNATSRTLSPVTTNELTTLHPMQRLERCTFDNVCSCIRRSVWRDIPFRRTSIAEDLEWAREVLLAGHCLKFVASAEVFHLHERSTAYEFSRTYHLHRRLFELFEVRTIPTLPLLARAVGSSLALHFACESRSPRPRLRVGALARAAGLAVAWPLGQYLGALSAARQWKTWNLWARV